jgi:hypothetical protein
MRKIASAAWFLVLTGAVLAQGGPSRPPLVRVTAQQTSISPPEYVVLISNMTDVPLDVVMVGVRRGQFAGVPAAQPNVPTGMTAPTGWTGRHIAEEGYLHYEWRASAKVSALPPDRSMCEFAIRLPVYHPKEPQRLGGSVGPVFAQVDFQGLTFVAYGRDGRYFEGVVHADPIER